MADAALDTVTVHRTMIPWLDRVLSGGLASDGVYLLSGDPGTGKSTLLVIVAELLAQQGVGVLYVTGEETRGQVARRAHRLKAAGNARVMATTSLADVVAEVYRLRGTPHDPDVIIIDSVQALSVDDGAFLAHAGSVVAVRELGHRLVGLAKDPDDGGRTILAIVQVVKDGQIAGPQALVHAGDARYHLKKLQGTDRLFYAEKDRFSGNLERVMLEMHGGGFREISDPNQTLLGELLGEAGVVAFPAMDEARVHVVPIEASVSLPALPDETVVPWAAIGFSSARLKVLLDLLRQHVDLDFARRTVRVEVPRIGGDTVDDEGLDLAVIAAVVSAYYGVPPPSITAWGKVGLSGKVQSVGRPETRLDAVGRILSPLAMVGGPVPPGPVRALCPRVRDGVPATVRVRPCAHIRDLLTWIVPPRAAQKDA
jgi:DNA repair protein RadA/Sms